MTTDDLSDHILLAKEKEELLALLLAENGIAPPGEPIPRRPTSDRPPLSFAQQRLWFVEQLGLTPGAYHIPIHLRLSGDLNPDALARSFTEIVRRHEALRTCFRTAGAEPYQHILDPAAVQLPIVELPVEDLRALAPGRREAEARRLATEETARPFDLAQGPMLRTRLLRLGDDDHILLITMHHVAVDGWSVGILMREMSLLYAAFARGGAAALPGLPVNYADFAVWQRQWLQGETLASQLRYWRGRLAGLPALEFPADRPRLAPSSSRASSRGSSQTFEIPPDLASRIEALARHYDATLYMFLLAAFQVLLHRYTGQAVVPVGSPVANRNRPEIEGVIGFFVNSIVLAADLGGDPPFVDLLARVRETVLGAMAHQDVPFEKIVEDLQPERDLARHPLFQVVFAMQQPEAMLPRLDLPGLAVSRWTGTEVPSRFDLELHLWPDGRRLLGICIYKAALFESAAITRLLGHFRSLIAGIVANPRQRISQLPLLTERERHEVEFVWNDTWRAPAQGCFHTAFERQAALAPDSIAVVFEDRQLTYRALNQKANRLAHYLRALGVGPEAPAGVRIERSLDMLIAVLAILKAGGAYVPLDGSWPAERTAFVIRDTGMKVIVSRELLPLDGREDGRENGREHGREDGPDMDARVVLLSREGSAISACSRENPPCTVQEDNLAYVLYTSGSTGIPKGVTMSHGGLMHYVSWCLESYGLEGGGRTLVHSSLAFDLTITALLAPLAAGGCVRLLAESPGLETLEQALLEESELTLLKLTPAHLEVLAKRLPASAASRARTFIVGGEALSAAALAFWRTHAPQTRIVNEYGPTEAAVGCCCHDIFAGQIEDGFVPIGRPIPNMRLYVADGAGQLAPAGIAGELLIAGAGLARGYLGRPALTAETWRPNPFGAEAGVRIYRSGDRARYRSDGVMEFLGRADGQVKIRGYRVELGEIEAALASHPSVETACVLLRDNRLVAYLATREAVDWRAFLAARLPEYMAPASYVILPKLPLTSNGKVDRQQLAAAALVADKSRTSSGGGVLEDRLSALFAELLGLQAVQPADNFFTLGGHSLLAYRLVSRIRVTLQVDIPLRVVFTDPTVTGLAGWIRNHHAPAMPDCVVALETSGLRRPLFLLPPAAGSPACYAALVESLGLGGPIGRPIYGIQCPGLVDDRPPLTRVEEMAEVFGKAIRAVQPDGPYYIGGWSFGAILACGVAGFLERQGEEVALLALLDGGPRDASRLSGRQKLGEALALMPKIFRALLDVRPGSYADFRRIGQWLGISLPESSRGLVRGSVRTQWRLLRNVVAGSIRAMRVSFANTKSGLSYSPPPYHGDITLFRTRLAERPTHDPLAAGLRGFTGGHLEIQGAPGSHMTLVLDPRNAATLAAQLQNCLARADRAQETRFEVMHG
jgi:amino acid adenylation domain-containing protein